MLAFVALERRVAHPLLPLGVVVDRNRGAAFPAIGTASAGLFGLLLFLTCYVQNTKDPTALETGLPFPRLSFSIAPTVGIVRACCPAPGRAGSSPPTLRRPRWAWAADAHRRRQGLCHARAAVADLVGIGFGLTLAPSFATATFGVPARDSGVASATVNVSQQVGVSIATALLSALAASAATDFLTIAGPAPRWSAGRRRRYVTALWWAAASSRSTRWSAEASCDPTCGLR